MIYQVYTFRIKVYIGNSKNPTVLMKCTGPGTVLYNVLYKAKLVLYGKDGKKNRPPRFFSAQLLYSTVLYIFGWYSMYVRLKNLALKPSHTGLSRTVFVQ
jgi:hypothetical protein